MIGWLGFLGYLLLWVWVMSPRFRFWVLPQLTPSRRVPWWDGPPFGYRL